MNGYFSQTIALLLLSQQQKNQIIYKSQQRVMSKSLNESAANAKYPKCKAKKDHAKQNLNLVCLNPACINKPITCSMCKTVQHKGHQVIPIKMLINKSDDIIKKKREKVSQQLLDQRQKVAQQLLNKIDTIHHQSMYLLQHFVKEISEQIRLCQQRLIGQYLKLKNIVNEEINKEAEFQTVLHECSRPFQQFTQMNLSVRRLLSFLKIQKNSYSIEIKTDSFFKTYEILSSQFKRNIEAIREDTFQLFSQIFQSKMSVRPSTAMTTKTIVSAKKYTFSSSNKPKSIQLYSQKKVAKQNDANIGHIVLVNENIGQKKQTIKFKVLAVNLAVSFGVALAGVVKAKNYKFSTTNHGTFMMSSNAYLYSHSNIKQNMVANGFLVKVGQQVQLELQGTELSFKKKNNTKTVVLSLKQLKAEQLNQICFCVCLNSNNDKVSII